MKVKLPKSLRVKLIKKKKSSTRKKEKVFGVPKLYSEGSKILKQHMNEGIPLKTLLHSSSLNYAKRKRLYELVCVTVKNSEVLKNAIEATKLFKKNPDFDLDLAQVLTADLIVKGKIEDQSKSVLTLLKYEEKLRQNIGSSFSSEIKEENEVAIPIYARVNTLLSTVTDVHAQLAEEGWTLLDAKPTSYDEFLGLVENLADTYYLVDYHIEELLVFSPNSNIVASKPCKSKAIHLQDKASCLPVFLSDIPPEANVIDACAAPGNKTSYIAASMNNTGNILAVERDHANYNKLVRLLKGHGILCANPKKDDFTTLPPEKHSDVEYIFVDPPCSATCGDEFAEKRIQRLASYQVRLLKCALSFPSVKQVIYSTFSGTDQENEEVINIALDTFGRQFYLEDLSGKLSGWKHFGNEEVGEEEYEFANRCLRTVPGVDRCQSLFVAKFIRKDFAINLNGKRQLDSEDSESDNGDFYPKKKQRRY